VLTKFWSGNLTGWNHVGDIGEKEDNTENVPVAFFEDLLRALHLFNTLKPRRRLEDNKMILKEYCSVRV
jgi:hypothetical protein